MSVSLYWFHNKFINRCICSFVYSSAVNHYKGLFCTRCDTQKFGIWVMMTFSKIPNWFKYSAKLSSSQSVLIICTSTIFSCHWSAARWSYNTEMSISLRKWVILLSFYIFSHIFLNVLFTFLLHTFFFRRKHGKNTFLRNNKRSVCRPGFLTYQTGKIMFCNNRYFAQFHNLNICEKVTFLSILLSTYHYYYYTLLWTLLTCLLSVLYFCFVRVYE